MRFSTHVAVLSSVFVIAGLTASGGIAQAEEVPEELPPPLVSMFSAVPVDSSGLLDGDEGLRVVAGRDTALAVDVTPDADIVGGVAGDVSFSVALPQGVTYRRVVSDLNAGVTGSWQCSSEEMNAQSSVTCQLVNGVIPTGSLARAVLILRGDAQVPSGLEDLEAQSTVTVTLPDGTSQVVTGSARYPAMGATAVPPMVVIRDRGRPQPVSNRNVVSLGVTVLGPPEGALPVRITGLSPPNANGKMLRGTGFECQAAGGRCTATGSWGMGTVSTITSWFAISVTEDFATLPIVNRYTNSDGTAVRDSNSLTVARSEIPGPQFAVEWETGSGQGVMPGEVLRVRTLVTNTVLAAHTPTLRVLMPQGITATPSASGWVCNRKAATTTCTRKSSLGPEEADLLTWRVRASDKAEAGTVDLRASVNPGPRSRSVAPITIGSFGDPIVGISVAERVNNRWRAWEDGSTRDVDVNEVGVFRSTLANIGGGTLRAGQRVTFTQEIGEGVGNVQVDSARSQCTFADTRYQCTLRVAKDVPPGEEIGRLRVGLMPTQPAARMDVGPLQARVQGSGSQFTEFPIRYRVVTDGLPLYIGIERVSTFTAGGGGEMFIRLVNEDSAAMSGIRLIGTLPKGVRLSPAVGSRNWQCDDRATADGGSEITCVLERTLTDDRPQALLRMPLLVDADAPVGPMTLVWRADALIPERQTPTTSVTIGIAPAATLNVSAHPAVVPSGSGSLNPVTLRSGLTTAGDRSWTHAWRQMCTTPVDTWPELCEGASSERVRVDPTVTSHTTAYIPEATTRARSYVFRVDASDGSSAVETDYVRVTSTPEGARGDITPASFAPGIDCPQTATTCTGQLVIPEWLSEIVPMTVSSVPVSFTQNPVSEQFAASVPLPEGLEVSVQGASLRISSFSLEIAVDDRVSERAVGAGTYVGPRGSSIPVTVVFTPRTDGGAVGFTRATGVWSDAFGMTGLSASDVVIAFERKGGAQATTTSVSGSAILPEALRSEFSMPDTPAVISGTSALTTLAVNAVGRVNAGDLGAVRAASIEVSIEDAQYDLAMDARFFQQRVNLSAPLQLNPVSWVVRADLGLTQLGNTLFDDVAFDAVVGNDSDPQVTIGGNLDVFGQSQRLSGPVFLDEGGTPVAALTMTGRSIEVGSFDLNDVSAEVTIVEGRDFSFSFGTGTATTTVLGENVTFDGLQFVFADNLIQRIFDTVDGDFTVGSPAQSAQTRVRGDLRLEYLTQSDELAIDGDMDVQAGEFAFVDARVEMQPTCAVVATRYRAQGNLSVDAQLNGLISAGGTCAEDVVPASAQVSHSAGYVCLSANVPRLGVGDARGPGDVFVTNAASNAAPIDCWDANPADDAVQGIAYASLLLGAENVDNSVDVRTEFGPGVVTADSLGVAFHPVDGELTTQALPGGTIRIAGFTLAKVNIVGTNTDGSLNLNGEVSLFGNTITFSGSYRDNNGVPETSLRAQQQNVRLFGFVTQGRDISLSQSRNGGSLSMGTGFAVKGIGSWDKRITFVVNGSDIRFYASGQTQLNVPGIVFGITLTFTNCTDATCSAGTNAQLRGRGFFAFAGLSFDTGQFVIDPVALFNINLSGSGGFSSSVSSGPFSASAWGDYSVRLLINADSFQASGSVNGGASGKAFFVKANISIGTSLSFNPLRFCITIISRNVCFSI